MKRRPQMEITREVIQHVAKLSRLKLSEEELIRFTDEFKSILRYVEKLNELDTSNERPTDHIFDVKNVFREDVVQSSFDRDKLLENAPTKSNGYFHVPKVVE
jgi:aspartyl-tRNA(Asn)/glutamyl-tRNA(Gln) amidotransferase subunit C